MEVGNGRPSQVFRTQAQLICVVASLLLDFGAASAVARPQDLGSYAGVWLVVPKVAPTQASPGAIPRAFLLSKAGMTLTGSFEINRMRLPLKHFEGASDALRLTFADSGGGDVKILFRVSRDGRMMHIWFGERPIGAPPFIARRSSLSELALLEHDAPIVPKPSKLPLPINPPVLDNGLARSPPMGWSSWNLFREGVDDHAIRQMADAMVSSGLRDAGYVYLNVDDGWQGKREGGGILQPNSKFPDIKALVEYVHSRGLKFGLYSSPGPVTCAGFLGSHGFAELDAKTFASWGVDYVKYDWCSAATLYPSKPEMKALFREMGRALHDSSRGIVYSISGTVDAEPWTWGRGAGANLWRTGADSIEGSRWQAISSAFDKDGEPKNAGPGGWNDPDMMLVGLGGLSAPELRTHFSLWSMLAAPIILGNDLRAMPGAVRVDALNREVIAVDQDPLGEQGTRIFKRGAQEIWHKHLANGDVAVAIFNRASHQASIRANWPSLGLEGSSTARDLWSHRALGSLGSIRDFRLPPHGTVLLRVSPPEAPKAQGNL